MLLGRFEDVDQGAVVGVPCPKRSWRSAKEEVVGTGLECIRVVYMVLKNSYKMNLEDWIP